MADGDLAFLNGPLPPHSILRSFHGGSLSAGPQAVDLVSLQDNLLKALGRSPDIVEQAKIILNSTNVGNKDQGNGISASDVINENPPQGRRQGMGRRKARFSMKPTLSQESENFKLKLDVENFADPEAYFSAVDKYENAAREVNKLKGQPSSNAQDRVQFATTRERRPGLARRRASYNHLGTFDDKDTSTLLRGGNRMSTSNLANVTEDEKDNSENRQSSLGKNAFSSEPFTTDKQEGFVVNKENRASVLLDSLLSSFQRDDEDGVTLLQENLQLKQIEVKKIRLPDSPSKLTSEEDITNTIYGVIQEANAGRDRVVSTIKLSNRTAPGANSLLQNSEKKARSSLVMSSLSKGSLAAMSMLQKRASMADTPMSAAYFSSSIDEEIGSGTCGGNQASTGKEGLKHLSGKSSPFISSQFELDDGATDEPTNLQNLASPKMNDVLHEDPTPRKSGSNSDTLIQNENDITSSLCQPSDNNISNMLQQEQGTDSEAKSPLLDRTAAHPLDVALVHPLFDGITLPNDNTNTMPLEDSNSRSLGDYVEEWNSEIQDENVNVLLNTQEDMDADGNQQPEADGTDDHDQNMNDLPHKGKDSKACKDQPAMHASLDQQIGQQSPRTQAEEGEEPQVVSRVLVKRKASKPHPQRWSRDITRRKSLATSGTSWKDGVRRSTRHRIRPLEYWRGERLLFGRIHDSLATVIGVKCSSPGGDANLKVKSYVSDQYKDLLELAALH